MVVAHINGKMLTWTLNRAGIEIKRLAKGTLTAEGSLHTIARGNP
jgi:hypothetical protein